MKSFLRICCVLLSVLLFSCEKDTMPASDAPNIITGQSANVYRKGATLYGNIKNPDASPVESFGIELASFSRPGMTIEQYFATAQSFEVDQMDAQGDFSVQVSGLDPGRMYLYRSFVNSGHNVVYGVDSTFQTPHNTAPIFGDMDTSEVSYTAFDISVNLLDDGGDSLQVMGYIYREAAEDLAQEIVIGPEIKSVYYPSNQLADQQFTLSIKDLHAGRRYAVRAFAMADGIGYSKMMYVKTRTSDATLVSACDTSDASYNSLHLKASILAENKQYPVTEVGFCYSSESSEPTVAHLRLPATLSGTDFEATLTQLISEKTYYIRAYARQSDNAYIYGEVLEYTPSDVFYTLSFDANGGSGEMPSQMYFPEVQQELSVNTFTRDGYAFTGWNTSPDGSGTAYTDQQEITLSEDLTLYAQWEQEQVISGSENGYDYVDLGLPSGLKWATCNVGATTPEGYGDHFAWGETSPKDNYDWSTYKYCNGSSLTLTKYNTSSSYGTVDNKTTLDLSDDAARANWGGTWRMPTYAELYELRNNCTWTWTTQNGVNGYRVTSKTNGNSIFLPAAGYRDGTSVYSVGSYGTFWSSSLNEGGPNYAYYLYFRSGYVDWEDGRYYGRTVRAVFTENDTPSTFVTITFNANGGTGTMAAQTFEAGVSQTITANTFTRGGYNFAGWNTAPDGSGTAYTDGQEITLSDNLTLYAQWKQEQVVSGSENGYDYVDLGLPSGLKWATCNVGATAPEGYGDYFAWGETEPKTNYDWSTYKYCEGTYYTMTKYCTQSSYGTVDNKTTLELTDDAARVNMGGKWRMPTVEDQLELINNSTCSFIKINGVYGVVLTSKINGNSIFMPAGGVKSGIQVYHFRSLSLYLSGSLHIHLEPMNYDYDDSSFGLYFMSDDIRDEQRCVRSDGHTVRAVFSDKQYTLSFNANGGTGTMAAQLFEVGVAQAIEANTFTRADYSFAGWNTAPDGSGTAYTDQQEITLSEDLTLYAQWEQEQVVSGTENGYEWVYLGLPSGLKWASCNVGATTPEEYGDYFAWGETSPKDNYDWSTYKYCNGSAISLTKYNTSSDCGTVDNKTTLELADDAARANWGGKWRMPTKTELDELRNNCTWTWTTQNGVNGYKVTSKTNGNSIFLPAAGYRNHTSVNAVGSHGRYWLSSLYESYPYRACSLYFYSGNVDWGCYNYRYGGFTVRSVCP